MYRTSVFAAAYQASASQSKNEPPSPLPAQKRKRAGDSSDEDGTNSDTADISSNLIADNTSSSPSDSEGTETSGGNFPYAYPNRDPVTMLLYKDQLTKELKGLNLDSNIHSRGIRASAFRHRSKLRRQVITNLVTALHRCLLKGEYARASRVWGFLLRVEQKKHPQFLRSNGRWGIGAEILLQRHPRAEAGAAQHSDTDSDSGSEEREKPELPLLAAALDKNGFENVRKYFDTMCVLYPHRKRSMNLIDEHVFKYAMFGLWICFVQEHAAVIRRGGQDQAGHTRSESESTSSRSEHDYMREQLQRSQTYLLEQAKNILAELESLVTRADYTDDKPLCKLRDMTKEWVEDLSQIDASSSRESDGD